MFLILPKIHTTYSQYHNYERMLKEGVNEREKLSFKGEALISQKFRFFKILNTNPLPNVSH